MTRITTEIEISKSPERVRAIFLNFANMPEWSQSWFKSIEPLSDDRSIEKGKKVKITLPSASFSSAISENTSTRFAWRASLPGIFTGEHEFIFQPSQKTPGGTTFLHNEDFSGILAPMMGKVLKMGSTTKDGFEAFNRDLKAKAESTP